MLAVSCLFFFLFLMGLTVLEPGRASPSQRKPSGIVVHGFYS